jgi:hypothetical protein
MIDIYRGPSMVASYQVSVQMAKLFQRRRFLEIDQTETSIAYSCLLVKRVGFLSFLSIFTYAVPELLDLV